jgi:hypothetical protein
MVIDSPEDRSRTLLGLRPPAELAERGVTGAPTAAEMSTRNLPERPNFPVISSGWDAEDQTGGKNSDLFTAIGAGAVLLLFITAVGLLFF